MRTTAAIVVGTLALVLTLGTGAQAGRSTGESIDKSGTSLRWCGRGNFAADRPTSPHAELD